MPAVSADGKVDGESDSHFACDARGISGGELCPEFTLFEGNMHGFRTTPRACHEPTSVNGGAHFTECDAEGDLGFDVHDQAEFTYGPGGDIDTSQTVDFKVDFNADGETLVSYTVTASQGDKSFAVTKEGEYLAKMSKYLQDGMVFQIR